MHNKTIKILIVDDHKMFLEGVQSILKTTNFIEVIGVAKNGKEALKLLNNLSPDIVITDIAMPEMNGLNFTKIVKEKWNEIKVIIVSSHNQSKFISEAIQARVNGYILKNTGKHELEKAIKLVFKGESYFSEEVKNSIQESIFNPKQVKEDVVKLSARETEVLKLISAEKNTQEIADELFISFNTVEAHRKNLMRKIGTKNMIGLVKYAIKQGIVK